MSNVDPFEKAALESKNSKFGQDQASNKEQSKKMMTDMQYYSMVQEALDIVNEGTKQ